ncbi:MAG: ATP-binding protein [Limnohabitans sp.]
MAFDLSTIKRGPDLKPPRLFLYAVEGIGKTTFAANAPAPIFIQTEDGLGALDVARFPMVEKIDDVREAIATLYTEQHEFQTVVLDSADWLEQIIAREIESKHEAKDLAYGKGALKQAEVWGELLAGFNALRNERGMSVILIGHCQIKRFDSPETEPYDRYTPKLQERSNALVREWADAVLFANYRTVVKTTEVGFKKEVSRGITTGERLIYTTEKPAYQAKNRYALPDSLPLSWDALSNAIAGRFQPAELKAA